MQIIVSRITAHATRASFSVSALLALGACGAAPQEGDSIEDGDVGRTRSGLYGQFSGCHTVEAQHDLSILGSPTNSGTGEGSTPARAATCDAYVADVGWGAGWPRTWITPQTQFMWQINETDCPYTWSSDRIYGKTHGGSFITLHDRDSALSWQSGSCKSGPGSHLPSQGNTTPTLRLEQSASVAGDRLSNYQSVRIINQPFYAFWSLRGQFWWRGGN
ncbi:MAG TPA: hypothetical protein VK524_00775 [Polyangiaceae bacterium]|nr:hypothetical protein [Polyangiaceae bacterium]